MLKSLSRRYPQVRVLFQQLFNKVLARARQSQELLRLEIRLLILYIVNNVFIRQPVIRRLPRSQHVQNHAGTPHITLAITLSLEELRRDVVWRANWLPIHLLATLQYFSQSKINQFDVKFFLINQYEVLKFYIAVAELLAM